MIWAFNLYPKLTHAQVPAALQEFIPENYTILDTAYGDLNLDEHPDLILILKRNGEDTLSDVIEHPEPRPLLILTGQADGQYRAVASNNHAVYCVNCGGIWGDPYAGITIKNGYFSVEHYGGSAWRWTRIITFKYSPEDNNWFLHKDGGDYYHAAEPEKAETNVKTVKDFGRVCFGDYDIYKSE